MNRLDLVKKKFPEHLDLALAIKDPSGNNKYLLWIAKQLSSGHNQSDITATVNFFHDHNKRFEEKDIYKYQDLKTLEDIIKGMDLSNRAAREQDKEGAVHIYEDDNFQAIRIDNSSAMVYYGKGTKWCVSSEKATYFEEYSCDGNVFYVVIPKNKSICKSSKYALLRKGLTGFEVFNAEDASIGDLVVDEKESKEFFDAFANVLNAVIKDNKHNTSVGKLVSGKIKLNDEAIEWFDRQTKKTKDYLAASYSDFFLSALIYKSQKDKSVFKELVERLNKVYVSYYNKKQYYDVIKSMGEECILEFVSYSKGIKLNPWVLEAMISAVSKDKRDAFIPHKSFGVEHIQFISAKSKAKFLESSREDVRENAIASMTKEDIVKVLQSGSYPTLNLKLCEQLLRDIKPGQHKYIEIAKEYLPKKSPAKKKAPAKRSGAKKAPKA